MSNWSYRNAALILALPFIIYLVVFTLYPIIYSIILSFSKVGLLYNFAGLVGLENYMLLFKNPFFLKTFINTLIFAFSVTAVDIVFSILLALSIERISRGKSVFTTLLTSPLMLPAVVVAIVWEIIMDPFVGPLDYFLRLLHFPTVGWLADPHVMLLSLIIITIWQTTPFAFLLVLAGVQAIPPQLKEAAMVDGLSTSDMFTQVTMPLILPSVVVAVLMTLITAFRTFDVIFVIDSGGFNPSNALLVYYAYIYAFVPGYQGIAMASIVILAGISTVLGILFIKAMGLENRLGLEAKKKERHLKLRISFPSFNIRPKISLVLAYLILIISVTFAFFPIIWTLLTSMHYSGIVMSLLPHHPIQGLIKNFSMALSQGAPYLIVSLVVAPVVAALTIILAAPAAYSIARFKLGGTKLLAWALYLYTVPSMVYLVPIYTLITKLGLTNTWWALMLIYPIFTLPLSVWILTGFYNDVPKEIDESALIDGKSRIDAFFDIILPIIRPALAVAAFFAILSSYTEFMFALTLGRTPYLFNFPPTGSETATVFVASALVYGSGEVVNYGMLAAAGLLVSIPVIIISAVLQKYIIKGLWVGGLKG